MKDPLCLFGLTANPGFASLIQAHSHTFVEIDCEAISTNHSPAADSRRAVLSYK